MPESNNPAFVRWIIPVVHMYVVMLALANRHSFQPHIKSYTYKTKQKELHIFIFISSRASGVGNLTRKSAKKKNIPNSKNVPNLVTLSNNHPKDEY
jgi:hypothetical protein